MAKSDTTYQFQTSAQDESDSSRNGGSAHSISSPYLDSQDSDSIGANTLSVALIGPDEERRAAVAAALAESRGNDVREFTSYPPALDDVPRLLEQYHDVIILDLDSNPEYALELVENICAKDSATVMVYSATADRDLVVRCMRAGAREYLTLPLDQNTMAEALVRAAANLHPESRPAKRTRGKMLVFLGAKGGSGVTTIACNFAVSLGQESGQNTLLIDLGLPMGDAALNLGIVAEYSTDNALLDVGRLDSSFLSKLLVKHRSGISVLAAPSKVPKVQATSEAIDKLMSVARQSFDNVIVDVGSRLDLMGTALFKEAYTIYLVTQAGISELRNSNRLISQFFNEGTPKLEIVINRFEARSLGVNEEHITKALTRPVQWKIPDDYAAARQMQNSTTTPSTQADSPISRLIRQMARSVCGLPSAPEKKAGFSFRNLSKSIAEKITTAEETSAVSSSSPSIAWPAPAPITCGTALSSAQLNAEATVTGSFVYTPGPGYVLPLGTHTLWATFTPADSSAGAPVQAAVSINVTKATPTINWSNPAVISCGTPLGAAQLNATASVPGTFVYAPAIGDVLAPGKHGLSVTFTPTDQTNYTTAQATVTLAVSKSTPTITWRTPAQMTCGSALSTAQLNAEASVPGTFEYSPREGEVLTPGRHTLSVVFTPNDTAGYSTAEFTVSVVVSKATPALSWNAPAPMTYGTVLSGAQLNAEASVAGSFEYTPGEGAKLAVGTHTPFVTFIPSDTLAYNEVQSAITLTVVKATPAIEWSTPEAITEGTPLSSSQLNATASVPGTFVYSPAAGNQFAPGTHTLSVTFTPADTANYTEAHAEVSISVAKITQVPINWPIPSDISYGAPLGSTQLNATAPVHGSFFYYPSAGDILPVGRHTLSVIFTPADTTQYATAQATVALVVDGLPHVASLHAPEGSFDHTIHPDAHQQAIESSHSPGKKGERQTRTYKGSTYEKGDDGQWHLQQT